MPCPRCGKESLPNDKFCENCGAPLAAAASPPSPAAPPAVQPALAAPPPQAAPASPEPLHPIPVGGLTMEDVVAWLQSAGYSAQVVTGQTGNRHIVSHTQGVTFNIFMHDGQGDRFASMRFKAGVATQGKFDISKMNQWNSDTRWCRGFYDTDNDPWIENDIDLSPGGTYESLNDQFGIWNSTLARFLKTYNLV